MPGLVVFIVTAPFMKGETRPPPVPDEVFSPSCRSQRKAVEAAGIGPVNQAMENPRQDALLPAIALILLGFVIPSRPTLCPRVPSLSPLEGHTGGT